MSRLLLLDQISGTRTPEIPVETAAHLLPELLWTFSPGLPPEGGFHCLVNPQRPPVTESDGLDGTWTCGLQRPCPGVISPLWTTVSAPVCLCLPVALDDVGVVPRGPCCPHPCECHPWPPWSSRTLWSLRILNSDLVFQT